MNVATVLSKQCLSIYKTNDYTLLQIKEKIFKLKLKRT